MAETDPRYAATGIFSLFSEITWINSLQKLFVPRASLPLIVEGVAR